MPTLIVLRHAKAVAGLGMSDIDRTLNDRGRRDAAATGDWLRANGLVPGHVLCSTAARTRETLDQLAVDAAVSFEPGIYDNDPDHLRTLVGEAPEDAARLLLVGHNPSVHQLVHDLTGEAPDAFPTCALAVIELPGPWTDVRPGLGTLRTVHTPKD
ncbi:histidine phosphatase family protein [Actinomadura darangshiensis]|uniref:Histidine phosphatase family protein n=1 Tax=Actinomadura darangshiensis TaxID=705336 RepID=A0A4R5AMG9_9ACTN|nr:histidine phosphatase family protein [Actinomadura darangshiensis]TDD72826.1 histidine phosphatase family protein [Actinomadura darangshiensis]